MATPYLIADSAQVTVLRSLASTAFGKYGLKLPEGVDLEDVYEVAAPGNELAYVSSLGDKRRVGGMFRRFVRADVNITAQGEDMVPASDVERVLDEAAKRVSGDFFLESDINKAGLGSWVPFVDFHVGDIANVEIWGRVVPLVVTRIEPKRTEHSDDDWSVHVGGQLLSDSEARLAENADIYNAVVSDRRELAGLDGKIRAETENRKSAVASESRRSDAYADAVAAGVESRLSSSFEASYERYSKALTQLGDTWRQELQKGLSAEQRARVEALRQEQQAREKAGTDLRGQLEKSLGDAVAGEARARQAAIANLSKSFTTDLQAYGELVKEAKNYVDPATKAVVEFWSKENQNSFNKAVQLTLSAQAAYNDVNNIKWVSQDAWNAQQQKINEARAKFEAQQIEINTQRAQFEEAQKKINELQSALDQEQDLRLKATELATSALSRDATRIMYIPRDTVALADSSMIGLNMPDINRRICFGALKSWRGKAIINVNYSSGSIRVYQVESKNLGFEGKKIGELYKAFPEGSILKYSAIDIPPGDVNSVTIFWQTYNG